MPRLRPRTILLAAVALLTTAAVSLAAPAFRAVITGVRVDAGKRTARVSFKAAGGSAARFRCALRPAGHPATFSDCRSPKTYKHLKETTYMFTVFAVTRSGVLAMPSNRTFTIGSTVSGTYSGRTSQTTPKFAAGVKLVVHDGVVRASSSVSWAARCTGQIGSFTDLTHFNGSVHDGRFANHGRQLQHLQGDTEDNSFSVQFRVGASRATGTFTDTTQVLHGSTVIAHCSTGTVRFSARR